MAEVILKAQNLVKKYGDKEVLKGVDLDIRAGEIFGIIGSSGSGKTTLLNSLIGFVSPTAGEIVFRDPHLLSYTEAGHQNAAFRNVLHYPTQVKEIFGFAAQDPSVYGKLTVSENLDLFGSLYNLSKDARKTNAHILLKLMGLYNSRKFQATNLSGGMVKRLDIACSLIHDPKILVLDEPTADLDPYLRRHMWDLIRKINKKGTTIIISSHYLDEIEELCDRIGIMSNGKIKHYGTPTEIKKLDDGSEEIHVRTESKRYEFLTKKLSAQKTEFEITQIRTNGSELVIRSKIPLKVIELIVKVTTKIEDPVVDLRLNKPSLNEIFASFVEENQGGDLAAHQQKVEDENVERAKTKRWYKIKQKCCFWKRGESRERNSSSSDLLADQNDLESISAVAKGKKSRRQKKQSVRRTGVNLFTQDEKEPMHRSERSRSRTSIRESIFKVFRSPGVKRANRKTYVAPKRDKTKSYLTDQITLRSSRFKKESRLKGLFARKEKSRGHSRSSEKSFSDNTLSDLADLRRRIEQLRVDTTSLNAKRRDKR